MNDSQYLQHYGILGQKWGMRRFQNPDGSLTEEGKKRYGQINNGRLNTGLKNLAKKINKSTDKIESKMAPVAQPKVEMTNEEIVKSGKASTVLENASRLSTQELQAANARIRELESLRTSSMKEVVAKNPNLMQKGAKIIGKAIADQATESLSNATKGLTAYGIKKTIDLVFPEGELKGVIKSSLNKKKDKNKDQGGN